MILSYNEFAPYVIHYTKHTERKKFLLNQFKKEKINPTFVENYDKENISYETAYNNFKMNIWEYQKRSPTGFSPYLFPLKPAEISLCLKMKESFRLFLSQSEKDFMFLMEDDVILCENFIETLNFYLRSLPDDWSAAFLGQGGGKRIDKNLLKNGINWYKKDHPADRCTDSILFTRKTVEKIYQGITSRRISFPLDHEFSYWFRVCDMKVYWLEPPIVAQGSQTGYFESFQDALSGKYEDKTVKIRSDMKELL